MKKSKKGCAGCFGCFALITILAVVAVAGFSYWLLGSAWTYEKVNFAEAEVTITEAPEKPTLYLGQKITYAAPPTEVPIAIVGATEIHISGDFLENVTLISRNVTASKGSRFAKDLDVKAAQFTDEGITLKGELTGKVGESKN